LHANQFLIAVSIQRILDILPQASLQSARNLKAEESSFLTIGIEASRRLDA